MSKKKKNVIEKIVESLKEDEYYSLNNILETNCQYNLIVGERSNGKTFACLKNGIQRYFEHGEQMALVRRWQDDLKGKRGQQMFSGIAAAGVIDELSGGEWTDVYYYAGRWYMCRYTEKKERITEPEPFCYGFAISAMEHDKSTSYPNVTTIFFDEFITKGLYLEDEFVSFMNVISTIVRQRKNVKIFMAANTITQYGCPYFHEMGIDFKKMKQGQIAVFQYGSSDLRVALEYCDSSTKSGNGKESDVFFAFDNPKLEMITGGSFELDIYPHCPCKYRPKDVILTFFVDYEDILLQLEIIAVDDMNFIFVHRKTTPIQDQKSDIIFSTEWSPRPNRYRNILKGTDKVTKLIKWFFDTDKVFYQDNETGELMKAYLNWCVQN